MSTDHLRLQPGTEHIKRWTSSKVSFLVSGLAKLIFGTSHQLFWQNLSGKGKR
jgi:hypothetical protein